MREMTENKERVFFLAFLVEVERYSYKKNIVYYLGTLGRNNFHIIKSEIKNEGLQMITEFNNKRTKKK
jgi:hypothetical protein